MNFAPKLYETGNVLDDLQKGMKGLLGSAGDAAVSAALSPGNKAKISAAAAEVIRSPQVRSAARPILMEAAAWAAGAVFLGSMLAKGMK